MGESFIHHMFITEEFIEKNTENNLNMLPKGNN